VTTRPLPWTDLVEAIGAPRFEQIRQALTTAKLDDLDRDAFLLQAPVGQLLRDMMPADAPAEAVSAYAALIHMMFVAWARDWPLVPVAAPALRDALQRTEPQPARTPSVVCYVQLPERLVWAEPVTGEPHEPLDGIFLTATRERADALAILGFRPGRDGFTTMEGAVALPAPLPPPRPGGSPPFASTLPAGERAGLISVADAHELLALALAGLSAREASDPT